MKPYLCDPISAYVCSDAFMQNWVWQGSRIWTNLDFLLSESYASNNLQSRSLVWLRALCILGFEDRVVFGTANAQSILDANVYI